MLCYALYIILLASIGVLPEVVNKLYIIYKVTDLYLDSIIIWNVAVIVLSATTFIWKFYGSKCQNEFEFNKIIDSHFFNFINYFQHNQIYELD